MKFFYFFVWILLFVSGSHVYAVEYLSFDNNDIPDGWELTNKRGMGDAGVINGKLQAFTIDGTITLEKEYALSSEVTEINIEYDAGVSYCYWGQGNQVVITLQSGDEYRVNHGVNGCCDDANFHRVTVLHNATEIFKEIPEVFEKNTVYESHYKLVYKKDMISYIAINKKDNSILFDITVDIPNLDVNLLKKIEFIVNTTTGNNTWMDNAKITFQNNEGSTPNEEEPETPVAILSENLDIHIPVLHYQVNEAETQNLEVFLSPAPNQKSVPTWQLKSVSNAVCSSTVNSCSNTYTSATAASNETNSQTPFNIHIPAINYLDNNYWANLKFAGTQNDNLTWELEDYGASEELFGKEQIARAITRALSKVGQDLAVSELIDSNLARYSADIIAHVLSYQTLFPITVEDISKIITPLKKKGDLFNQGSKKDYLFLVTDILIEGVKSYVEFKYKDDIGTQKGFVWMTDIAYNNIKAAVTGNVLDGVISNGKVLYDIGKENYNAYGEYVAITWDVKYSQTFGNIATLADTYQQYYSKSPSSKQHFLDEFESKCLEHKEKEGIVFSSDYLLAFNSKVSLLCIEYQVKFRDFDENKEGGINYFTAINDKSGFMTFLERYIHPDERDIYIQVYESKNGV